jgi:hypothetical protein
MPFIVHYWKENSSGWEKEQEETVGNAPGAGKEDVL